MSDFSPTTYTVDFVPSEILATDSSLFIGTTSGTIIEWSQPQQTRRIFQTTGQITSLLECGQTLWSASSNSITIISIPSGLVLRTVSFECEVKSMVNWKSHV